MTNQDVKALNNVNMPLTNVIVCFLDGDI